MKFSRNFQCKCCRCANSLITNVIYIDTHSIVNIYCCCWFNRFLRGFHNVDYGDFKDYIWLENFLQTSYFTIMVVDFPVFRYWTRSTFIHWWTEPSESVRNNTRKQHYYEPLQNFVSIGVPLSNININSEALSRHFPEHRRCYAYLKQKGGKEKPSI